MKNEIKEILDRAKNLKYKCDCCEEISPGKYIMRNDKQTDNLIEAIYIIDKLLDYITNLQDIIKQRDKDIETLLKTIKVDNSKITNLQEELEDLREDNFAYHQLMKMQNKREYRSKFLKEFQEEFGTNTFPDYDEIYKRYDKIKKENERLKTDIRYWEDKWQYTKFSDKDYKSRNEKAIEYINENCIDDEFYINLTNKEKNIIKVLDILNGGDKY